MFSLLRRLESYYRASIMNNTIPYVVLGCLYTTGLVFFNLNIRKIASSDLPIQAALTVVIGFLFAFRTNSAYERYWEGRKAWGAIISNSTTLARLIWIQVQPNADLIAKGKAGVADAQQVHKEKLAAIKAVLLYGHSMLHKLRGDTKNANGTQALNWFSQDYYKRDPRRKRIAIQTECSKLAEAPEGALFIDVEGPSTVTPDNASFKSANSTSSCSLQLIKQGTLIPHNPPTILTELSQFLYRHSRNPNYMSLDGKLINEMEIHLVGGLAEMNCVCTRIKSTPVPRAYNIHLEHILTLYCMALPLSIIGPFGFLSVPITALIYYVIIGVYKIAKQIENPWEVSENGLPLEHYLFEIEKQVRGVIGAADVGGMSFGGGDGDDCDGYKKSKDSETLLSAGSSYRSSVANTVIYE